MPFGSTDTTVANRVLSYLKVSVGKGYFSDTSRIAIRCNIPKEDQADLRSLLSRLYRAGLVERSASGPKLRWSIKAEDWDTTNPFRRAPNYGTGEKAQGMIQLLGDTYGNRDGIKSIPGWRFVKEERCWLVPSTESNKTRVEGLGLRWEEYTGTGHQKTRERNETNEPEEAGEEVKETGASSAELRRLSSRVHTLEQENRGLKEANGQLESAFTTIVEAMAQRAKEMEQVKEMVRANVRTVKVERYDGKVLTLENKVLPKVFDKVASLARCRRNILLVGPAGCGKTYLAKLVQEALGLKRFGKVGGSEGLDETHLIGYSRPNLTSGKDKFVTTPFLECFEGGGLCLLDELDRANPNVMLVLNAALDTSGDLPVPVRGDSAKKHADFVCVATANTYGRGADRMYAGANQLDEATLDRFRIGIVECDYDPVIDAAVCPDDELREWCQNIRAKINSFGSGFRRLMSTRFLEDAYVMKAQGGWTMKDVEETYFAGWSRDEKAKVMSA